MRFVAHMIIRCRHRLVARRPVGQKRHGRPRQVDNIKVNRDRRHGLDSSGSKQVSEAGCIDDLQSQKHKGKLLNTMQLYWRTWRGFACGDSLREKGSISGFLLWTQRILRF
jgi:hypothetical protein